MTDTPLPDEAERLRRENEALNEQIKLLVQTEQRLYRSQNELDSQLARVRALSRFALDAAGLERADEIRARAVQVLWEAFAFEWAGIVRVVDDSRAVALVAAQGETASDPAPRTLSPALWDWLQTLREPRFITDQTRDAAGLARGLMRVIAPAAVPEEARPFQGHLACAPLRAAAGGPGLLLAYSPRVRVRGTRYDWMNEHHLPFLELLASHVDRAVESAALTERLRERSEQLTSSLASLERAQQELIQAHKLEAVGRLAGGVAHDFNNLLTVILGYAGTLQSTLPPDSPHQQNVRHILEASQRAASTVRQLLAHGRRQMQRREDFDLTEQTQRTIELLRRLVGENILLQLQLDPGLGAVRADRSQVEQVLLNLVVNARDAMPEGGTMRVTTRRARPDEAARCGATADAARFAVLEVEDTGVGMDAETRSRIFEPFFTTKGSGRGTGLGLAVVYGVVKQSDGHILVDSAPGQGSRFAVLLPLASGTVAPLPPPLPEPGAGDVRGSVLVVEDEASIREVLVAALRQAGHQVTAAADGEQALALVAGAGPAPDLVLTDVVMPRLGGVKLARELARRRPMLRVAYMSGYSEDLLANGGARSELTAFLAKPFTPEQLVRFVALQLAGARAGQRTG